MFCQVDKQSKNAELKLIYNILILASSPKLNHYQNKKIDEQFIDFYK